MLVELGTLDTMVGADQGTLCLECLVKNIPLAPISLILLINLGGFVLILNYIN